MQQNGPTKSWSHIEPVVYEISSLRDFEIYLIGTVVLNKYLKLSFSIFLNLMGDLLCKVRGGYKEGFCCY